MKKTRDELLKKDKVPFIYILIWYVGIINLYVITDRDDFEYLESKVNWWNPITWIFWIVFLVWWFLYVSFKSGFEEIIYTTIPDLINVNKYFPDDKPMRYFPRLEKKE